MTEDLPELTETEILAARQYKLENQQRAEVIRARKARQEEYVRSLASEVLKRLTHCPACGVAYIDAIGESTKYLPYEDTETVLARRCLACGRDVTIDINMPAELYR